MSLSDESLEVVIISSNPAPSVLYFEVKSNSITLALFGVVHLASAFGSVPATVVLYSFADVPTFILFIVNLLSTAAVELHLNTKATHITAGLWRLKQSYPVGGLGR